MKEHIRRFEILLAAALAAGVLAGCAAKSGEAVGTEASSAAEAMTSTESTAAAESTGVSDSAGGARTAASTSAAPVSANRYEKITPEEALAFIEAGDCIILDVREQSEYEEGHIPGAMRISYTDVGAQAADQLPDRDQVILVYCRTGVRSRTAAQTLSILGYTQVKDIGGIVDWPYEIER